MLVNTVENNFFRYYECEYSRALEARKVQYKVALPSHRHLIKMIDNKNHIENCPLNQDNLKGIENTWGDNLG